MTSTRPDARPDARPPRAPEPDQVRRGSFTARALVLVLAAAVVVVALAVPVRAWFAQRAEIAGLRADVEAARERVAALQLQKERWEDPSFVAAEARRRLHFVLPGEIGYVTLGTEEEITMEATADAMTEPWYASLWGALREADGRDDAAGS